MKNPYDCERDYFVEMCRRSVDYMKKLDEIALRQIYMKSTHKYFEFGETIFDVGQKCHDLMLILSGWVEIGLTDGKNYMQLDYLSRGSFLCFYGVLMQNDYNYKAFVISP